MTRANKRSPFAALIATSKKNTIGYRHTDRPPLGTIRVIRDHQAVVSARAETVRVVRAMLLHDLWFAEWLVIQR